MITFNKVTTLPGTPAVDAVYFELAGTECIGYVTDTAGVARPLFNQALTDARIAAQLSANQSVVLVADFPAANALVAGALVNQMVLATDASADPTVTAGAALYFLDATADTLTKVSEFESLDVVLDWNSIANRPSAPTTQIDAAAVFIAGLTATRVQVDQAVTDSHTHANKATLDAITDTVGDGTGNLLFNGNPITLNWATLAW